MCHILVEKQSRIIIINEVCKTQKKFNRYVRFEVFMAVRIMTFLWVLAPCRLVGRCHRFGETYCLHLPSFS
jgi:hypothetical protein